MPDAGREENELRFFRVLSLIYMYTHMHRFYLRAIRGARWGDETFPEFIRVNRISAVQRIRDRYGICIRTPKAPQYACTCTRARMYICIYTSFPVYTRIYMYMLWFVD